MHVRDCPRDDPINTVEQVIEPCLKRMISWLQVKNAMAGAI